MSRSLTRTHTSGHHRAYGKVILFGEHFVVYGAPAIVAAVTESTVCALKAEPSSTSPGLFVTDDRPAVPGYISEKRQEQREAHELVLKHLGIDLSTTRLEMHLGGTLVPTSGIGASAADVVAFARALNELFDLNLSEDEVNAAGYAGECGYHGTPSGIDNTAATFGGLLVYRRTSQGPQFEPIKSHSTHSVVTLPLVVVSTGITSSTTKVIADVRELKVSNESQFSEWLSAYHVVFSKALQALEGGDLTTLGNLLNENHALCEAITVSCAELNAIVQAARGAGALGSKMSGTGRGGIVIALCSDEASQDVVASALGTLPQAAFVWKYTVKY